MVYQPPKTGVAIVGYFCTSRNYFTVGGLDVRCNSDVVQCGTRVCYGPIGRAVKQIQPG